MASPKMCLDCDRVTWMTASDAKGHGWANLFSGYWNDLWRCQWCNDKGRS